MGGGGLVGKQAGLHNVPGLGSTQWFSLVLHSVPGLGSAQWFSLILHSVPGLGSARLRTTNTGPRGQTRRSVSIGEKMYTSLRCKPVLTKAGSYFVYFH